MLQWKSFSYHKSNKSEDITPFNEIPSKEKAANVSSNPRGSAANLSLWSSKKVS